MRPLSCAGPRARCGVEEDLALVEERRVGRVEILRRRVGIERAPAEGDDAAAQVGDREGDAVAEAVVGDGDVVAADQHARRDHLLDLEPRACQVRAQRRAIVRRIAEAKRGDRLACEPALFQIAPRLGARAGHQRRLEERCRHFDDAVEPLALVLARFIARAELRHRHAGFAGQPLDRLGKRQPVGLHEEREDVAVLAGGEAVVEALLVVDREGRRLLHLERGEALELAPSALQRNLAPHDLADAEPRANFVQEIGRIAHARGGSLVTVG